MLFGLFLLEAKPFDLHCNFAHTSFNQAGSLQTCQGSLSITEKNQTLSSVNFETNGEMMYNSQSGSYLKSSAVKGLTIDSQTVHYMPNGIEKFFSNLEALRISSSGLKEIDSEDLKPFKKLKELQLSSNELIVLKYGLFDNNPDIIFLQFDGNQLKYVGENILDPLKKISYAYFQNCGCINHYVPYGSDLSTLKNSLKTQCPSIEKMKITVCGDDFEVFEEKIFSLTNEVEKINNENSALKAKLKSMYTSCDGNLDAATKKLHMTSKKLGTCDILTRSDEPQQTYVNMTCVEFETAKCKVGGELKVDTAETMLNEVTILGTGSSNITTVIIYEQQTLFLPQRIGIRFPFLTELSVKSSGLYEISQKSFKDMKSLETLCLKTNKIIEIPSDTFDELENLLNLDLSYNNIQKLEKEVFKGLKKLEVLHLDSNKIVSINSDVLKPLLNLQELFLHNNNIEFISANLLTPLKQLTNVDLSANDCIDMSHPDLTLADIETQIIDSCIAPIGFHCIYEVGVENSETESVCKAQNLTVEFPKTKVSQIEPENNEISTTLIIDNQSIQFLPFKLALFFPELEKLVVENSQLSSLYRHDFKNFNKLRTLEIRRNNLTFIEEGAFDEVKDIGYLDLSHNSINSLPSKIFLNLVHLRTLILSHNKIEKFTADVLPRKNSIEEFHVDNNELELIETKILRYLRKAKLIDLTENVCIDLKFDKSDEKSKSLVELSGEIDLNCSSDD